MRSSKTIISDVLKTQNFLPILGENSRFDGYQFMSKHQGIVGFRQYISFRYLRLHRSYDVAVGLEHTEGRKSLWSAITKLGVSNAEGVCWIGDTHIRPCLVIFPVSLQLGFSENGIPVNCLATEDWPSKLLTLMNSTFSSDMDWPGYVRLLLKDYPSEFSWARGSPGFRLAALCLAAARAGVDERTLTELQEKYHVQLGKSDFLGSVLGGRVVESLYPLLGR